MSTRKCNVLLVDAIEADRAGFRAAIQEAIAGIEVVAEAKDGQEAIEYLEAADKPQDWRKHPYPHLVVMDLYLPRTDGFEVLKWLQDRGRRPLVIVFSKPGCAADGEQSVQLGADKYLQKPEGLPEVIGFIQQFCRIEE